MRKLRRFAGAPAEFWPHLLNSLAGMCGSSRAALYRIPESGNLDDTAVETLAIVNGGMGEFDTEWQALGERGMKNGFAVGTGTAGEY